MAVLDEILTIREIAMTLKLADKTVYAMATEGELPAFKLRGQWRVRRNDFDAWLATQVAATRGERGGNAVRSAEGKRSIERVTRGEEEMSDASSPIVRPADPEPVGDLSERVSQEEMHRRFARALGPLVRTHGGFGTKPFEMDLAGSLPQRVRVYMYNATRPPGGRPLGEHKVQLMVPGQGRGERGSFDSGDGRIVLLVGYAAEEDVFVLWDAGLYPDFAWSRNVQVKAETIMRATAGKLATQERQLRPSDGGSVTEIVVAAKPRHLADAIVRRMDLTRARLLRE